LVEKFREGGRLDASKPGNDSKRLSLPDETSVHNGGKNERRPKREGDRLDASKPGNDSKRLSLPDETSVHTTSSTISLGT
jgi:hypothetical protein